jgi:hypothetical protein
VSIIDTVKSFFAPSAPATTFATITITSSLDYEGIPKGFFRVLTLSGKESRGWNGSFLCWRVGKTVVDGGQRHTCDTPLSELPTVKLNFQKPQGDGVQNFAGASIIDTDLLEADSAVVWDGGEPASGIAWI